MSDGLFLDIAKYVAKDYPDIEHNDMDIKECCTKLMSKHSEFDVLLVPNLYGNIISHIACGMIRGVGLISGKNFGDNVSFIRS
jgi:Isocitrate/isopropylmalate dehydrogenase